MKKKFVCGIAVVVIAVVAAWNVSQSKNEMALTDVALANVEALAGDEQTPTYECPGGTVECVRVNVGNEVNIFYKPA